MPKNPPILDLSTLDFNHVVADLETIRRYNLQRHEMEQLTAIVHEDTENHVCAGYKDLGPDEFWIRGHMPGVPLMPGVIMCEAAAQLASYYTTRYKILKDSVLGFGGLEQVRFRGMVRPGERFVIVAKMTKIRRAILACEFQCYVGESRVCDGIIKGIALPLDQLARETLPQD